MHDVSRSFSTPMVRWQSISAGFAWKLHLIELYDRFWKIEWTFTTRRKENSTTHTITTNYQHRWRKKSVGDFYNEWSCHCYLNRANWRKKIILKKLSLAGMLSKDIFVTVFFTLYSFLLLNSYLFQETKVGSISEEEIIGMLWPKDDVLTKKLMI